MTVRNRGDSRTVPEQQGLAVYIVWIKFQAETPNMLWFPSA
jgi:hypothetical protein